MCNKYIKYLKFYLFTLMEFISSLFLIFSMIIQWCRKKNDFIVLKNTFFLYLL
jgi:hypothetical protein